MAFIQQLFSAIRTPSIHASCFPLKNLTSCVLLCPCKSVQPSLRVPTIFKQPTSFNKCFLVHDALQVCTKSTWQPIEAEVSLKGCIFRIGIFTFIFQRTLCSDSGAVLGFRWVSLICLRLCKPLN